jgi:ribosomal-protein-alanine N-acetyltransferase
MTEHTVTFYKVTAYTVTAHPMTAQTNRPGLTTARLLLRPLTLEDVDPLFAIMSQPNIMRFFPRPADTSRERAQRIIARQIETWELYGYGFWALELAATPGLIGWCGLGHIAERNETEVGYLLSQPYWGRGLATEAARASVEWGFATLNLALIVGLTHPDNTASQNVLRKAGLRFTGPDVYFGMDCLRFARERAA